MTNDEGPVTSDSHQEAAFAGQRLCRFARGKGNRRGVQSLLASWRVGEAGNRWCRFAQPPANGYQASGLRQNAEPLQAILVEEHLSPQIVLGAADRVDSDSSSSRSPPGHLGRSSNQVSSTDFD